MARRRGVLWIDDHFVGPKAVEYVRTLKESLAERGLRDVTVKAFPNASDAVVGLYEKTLKPEVIVFDWHFTESAVLPEQVLEALHESHPTIPVIVFTGVAEPGQVKRFPNVRQLIRKPAFDLLVEALVGYLVKIDPTVLVLSDLHFGAQHGLGGALTYDTLMDTFRAEAATYLRNAQPNMLLLCGDLTSQGSLEEFSEARRFLEDFCDTISIPRSSVFIVPGNHDVMLADKFSYNHFRGFVERFYAGVPEALAAYDFSSERAAQDELVYVRTTSGVAATIIGLNSTQVTDDPAFRVGSFPRGTMGSVLTGQLSKVSKWLGSFGSSEGVRMAVLHHPLFPVPTRKPTRIAVASDDSRVVAGQALLLNWLADNDIQVVFHGHSHYPAARTIITHYTGRWRQKGKPIHVLASGTAGAASHAEGFHEHHYAVVDVVEDRLEVRARVLSLDAGTWRSEPSMSASLRLDRGTASAEPR